MTHVTALPMGTGIMAAVALRARKQTAPRTPSTSKKFEAKVASPEATSHTERPTVTTWGAAVTHAAKLITPSPEPPNNESDYAGPRPEGCHPRGGFFARRVSTPLYLPFDFFERR